METRSLLEKLIEIERAVGRADRLFVRGMLLDAEAMAVEIEHERLALLAEVRQLRQQQVEASTMAAAGDRRQSHRPLKA
jgi:hypothetical protein